ncbi:MAG: phosphoribosylglycinamide formyltransferase [Candidatus Calescibacterium sp.]|nr:phosphoribosylglycinamide formyltransferase [Candidatus Calescibacterium sp.]MCX7734945.1 phosphoribosylglycinamide formyltransferase [bacterium]MDW8088000.1 phosphoribosylglycinamide formyltransferase [Candidatus Calescibacterium sp.]
MKHKIVVFASGSGSNFENIVLKSKENYIPAEVSCLVTDKAGAGAIKRAIRYGVKVVVVNWKPRYLGEKNALCVLEKENPSLVVFAGFMKVVSPEFVSHWRGKILNIHPALLPAFEGTTNAIELSVEKRVRIAGCTVHFVDESVDGGPIIAQAATLIDPDEEIEKIEQKIHSLEHKIYPAVIKGILEGKIIFDQQNNRVIFKDNKMQLSSIFSIEI